MPEVILKTALPEDVTAYYLDTCCHQGTLFTANDELYMVFDWTPLEPKEQPICSFIHLATGKVKKLAKSTSCEILKKGQQVLMVQTEEAVATP